MATNKRLTDRQVVVLSAVERLGEPTVPELARELSTLGTASEVVRVLDALEAKRLVEATGNRIWRYLGDPAGMRGAPQIAPSEVVRYRRTSRKS